MLISWCANLVSALPWGMRNHVEGYVDAVHAALPEIERDSGTKIPNEKTDLFLFLCAIRRIWAAIDSQYWIINDCISIAKSRGLNGFQTGRDAFTAGSSAAHESRELREKFEKMITELGIRTLVMERNLADVMRTIALEDL